MAVETNISITFSFYRFIILVKVYKSNIKTYLNYNILLYYYNNNLYNF